MPLPASTTSTGQPVSFAMACAAAMVSKRDAVELAFPLLRNYKNGVCHAHSGCLSCPH